MGEEAFICIILCVFVYLFEAAMVKSFIFSFFLILSLSGCAQQVAFNNGESQWDFDHNVQFSETRLSDVKFHIEVIPNKSIEFERLATFLLRRALDVCQNYGFKIEVLKGIEEYDDRRSFPNLIMPRLAANVECPLANIK